MVLIDLQKAFDTVNHEILLSKMESMGVASVSWFKSYLSQREQCVEVNGKRSDFLEVTCGIPQGSILGPQLFLLYINDLSASIDCNLSLYADDSALIFAHKDPKHIVEHLSAQLTKCKGWLTDNKLSLHVGKTESILFGSNRKLKGISGFEVTCEGSIVKQVTDVKYLGVQLSGNLNGRSHAEGLIKKCAARLSFLYRNAAMLDHVTRKTLCSALIQPYMDYCCSSWYSGLTKQLKQKLDVIQRRMVRYIFSMHHMSHVDTRNLHDLSWLSMTDRVRYFKLCHVFRIKAGTAPEYMGQNFKPSSAVHGHFTRGSSSSNFFLSKGVADAPTSFSFTAIKEWNNLPPYLKEIASESVFKRKLKEHFLSEY